MRWGEGGAGGEPRSRPLPPLCFETRNKRVSGIAKPTRRVERYISAIPLRIFFLFAKRATGARHTDVVRPRGREVLITWLKYGQTAQRNKGLPACGAARSYTIFDRVATTTQEYGSTESNKSRSSRDVLRSEPRDGRNSHLTHPRRDDEEL